MAAGVAQMEALSAGLVERFGWHFPRERWADLERCVLAVARDQRLEGAQAGAAWVLEQWRTRSATPELDAALARQLTVGETYFFRTAALFGQLERLLARWIDERRGREQRLRLWSAGCCTGEEVYSLAILVHRLLRDPENWELEILGTDVNPHFLRRAEAGEYGVWSFRGTPPALREECFDAATPNRYRVPSRFRRGVRFERLNLAAAADVNRVVEAESVDLVLCRNVLLYFEPEAARAVVRRLHRSLRPGGCLVLATCECDLPPADLFEAIPYEEGRLHRKHAGASRAPSPSVQVGAAAAGAVLAAIPGATGRVEERPATAHEGSQTAGTPSSTNVLARELANRGDLAAARATCEEALSQDGMNAGLHYLLATIQLEEGNEAGAVVSLRRSLYLDPEFVLAHLALHNQFAAQGRMAEAGRHRRSAQRLLSRFAPADALPEGDGLTAGDLQRVLESLPTLESTS